MDIQEFPDAQPVPPEVREQLLESFIAAVSLTLTVGSPGTELEFAL